MATRAVRLARRHGLAERQAMGEADDAGGVVERDEEMAQGRWGGKGGGGFSI